MSAFANLAPGPRCGNNTVQQYFDQQEVSSGCTNVVREVDQVASHNGSGMIWFILLRADLALNADVSNVFSSIWRNFPLVYEKYCVCAFDSISNSLS